MSRPASSWDLSQTRFAPAVRRRFTISCRQLDLFGGDLVAIPNEHRDGLHESKFTSHNANHRTFTQKKPNHQRRELENRSDDYLQEQDQADQVERGSRNTPDADRPRETIEAMHRRQAEPRETEQHSSGKEIRVALERPGKLSSEALMLVNLGVLETAARHAPASTQVALTA